jgi:hypothetical protein
MRFIDVEKVAEPFGHFGVDLAPSSLIVADHVLPDRPNRGLDEGRGLSASCLPEVELLEDWRGSFLQPGLQGLKVTFPRWILLSPINSLIQVPL